MRKACYRDLMEKYENPIEHACDMEEGQVFIANGWEKPEGLCESAWQSMSPFVMALAHGGNERESTLLRTFTFYVRKLLSLSISIFSF